MKTVLGLGTITSDLQLNADLDFIGPQSITTTTGELTLNAAGFGVIVPDGDGLVVGHTAQITTTSAKEFQVLGKSGNDGGIIIARFGNNTSPANLDILKSRDPEIADGTFGILINGDDIGHISFLGDDGTAFNTVAARIIVEVDGSPGTGVMPGRIIFATTAAGAGSPAERVRIAADGTLTVSTGSIDLNNQGSLINVGASGNDWTATALTLANTNPVMAVTATNASGASELSTRCPASSTGGEAGLNWKEGTGAGTAGNMMYSMAYRPGSQYIRFRSNDTDGSATKADIFRILDAQLSVDANTTWDENIFDSYDDAAVLSPYRHGRHNLSQRKADLIEMGVLREYDDGFIGYNDQRMAALLAGGIYQTRERMDAQHEAIDERLKRIEQALGV